MSHWAQAIAETDIRVQEKEYEVHELKQLVNLMCRQAGLPEKYPEIEGGAVRTVGGGASPKLQPDQFVGKPLNTAVKEVLILRRAAQGGTGGTATAEEIYAAMVAGGFEFESNKETAINGLRISLGKSSHTFKRLTNGAYGLHEWYGTKPKPKAAKDDSPGDAQDGESGAEKPAGSSK